MSSMYEVQKHENQTSIKMLLFYSSENKILFVYKYIYVYIKERSRRSTTSKLGEI